MHTRLSRGRRRGPMTALTVATVLAIALPASTLGTARFPNPDFEYVTLTPAAAGGRVIALINSGDTFDGVTFEGIPDGLGVVPVGQGDRYVDLYVAFEQSHVPFEERRRSGLRRLRGLVGAARAAGSQDDAAHEARRGPSAIGRIHPVLLGLHGRPGRGILRLHVLRQRGVERHHRRAGRGAVRSGSIGHAVPPGRLQRWRSTRRPAPTTRSRSSDAINHENTVVVPGGWDDTVALSGDDTFTAPTSQLYMGTAASPGALVADDGDLWAFRVTGTDAGAVNAADPQNNANDYPRDRARRHVDRRVHPGPGCIARGTTAAPPQTALENWSNANNVFQFVRVEDMAYDPDDPRVVYFADTGIDTAQGGSGHRAALPSRRRRRCRTSTPTGGSSRWCSTRTIRRSSTSSRSWLRAAWPSS